MYVSYRGTHSICKYSLHGEFLEEYGGSKGSALGQFNGTLVSGTDSERALIVCDCYNNRPGEEQRGRVEAVQSEWSVTYCRCCYCGDVFVCTAWAMEKTTTVNVSYISQQ